jgi:ATP adenylyltransferase
MSGPRTLSRRPATVSDDRLWAPWRYDYIRTGEGNKTEPPPPDPSAWRDGADLGCFLCRAAAEHAELAAADRQLLVVDRGPHSLVLLNRYPYNNGHALVAPLRHVAEIDQLTADEHLGCMNQLGKLVRIYRRLVIADGFNVGLNLGRAAGAGVPGHLHWHLVPRWQGDHNFMPVLAGTHVIPQSLDALWEMLSDHIRRSI